MNKILNKNYNINKILNKSVSVDTFSKTKNEYQKKGVTGVTEVTPFPNRFPHTWKLSGKLRYKRYSRYTPQGTLFSSYLRFLWRYEMIKSSLEIEN